MAIKLIKHINKQEGARIEYLFDDFPYIDGNELVSQYLKQLYDVKIKEYLDGVYYNITKIDCGSSEYILVWHEDIGNYGYCIPQTKENIEKFEQSLMKVFELINEKIEQ